MEYSILVIGYLPTEYKIACEKWSKQNVKLTFANSALQAEQLLKVKQFSLAVFHSRMLDNIPYINVMRSNPSVPFLVLTPQYTNYEQIRLAIQYQEENFPD